MVKSREPRGSKKKGKTLDFDLYLITDRKVFENTGSLVSGVRQALMGGVKAVQLREKDLDTRKLLRLAYSMRDVTKEYKAKLFINDRFDIALAVDADGVHLAQSSIPVDAVRKTVGTKLMIGVSTHSLKEAKVAEKGGADFVTFGPVYETPSKRKYGPPAGLDSLKQVCRKLTIPVFALGGVKRNRIKSVKAAGAYGVSMISGIFRAGDIQGRASKIISALEV